MPQHKSRGIQAKHPTCRGRWSKSPISYQQKEVGVMYELVWTERHRAVVTGKSRTAAICIGLDNLSPTVCTFVSAELVSCTELPEAAESGEPEVEKRDDNEWRRA